MALLRRRTPAHPISDFWAWWAADGHRIDPTTVSPLSDELTRRVGAIHPDLTWHFGAGETSEHRLTVSAGGVAAARPAAERWFRAAPAPSARWEFRPAQEAEPGAMSHTLEIAGFRVDLSLTTFAVEVDHDELRVHVGVHHPELASMPGQGPMQVAYLVLDWLLGEDDVERWVGQVDVVLDAESAPSGPDEVRSAVAGLAASREPDAWVMAQWLDADGAPGLAVFRRGLRWLDHPSYDRHWTVSVEYAAQANGLPADGTVLDGLQRLEDGLTSAIAGRGVLVAIESHRGRRTFHVYADGEDQNADDAVRGWAASAPATVADELDPSWTQVRRFTG